jgi:hypothetical protein
MFLLGLKAAGMRVPFIPTRIGLGTDVLRHNPAIKLIQSPYADGKEWVAMPAIWCSWGPPWSAGKTDWLILRSKPRSSLRKKIIPARGPRRLLWVVVVTTSA